MTVNRFSSPRKAALAFAGALVLAAAAVSGAQAETSVNVQLGGSGPASRSLSLPRGKSAIIDLPVDARDVLVSNPAVADAVLRTPRRIYVLGQTAGQTDAVFFDAAGRQILSLNIRVDQSTDALLDTVRRLVPGSDVKVEAVADSVVLTGSVANAADADRVQRLAERFVGKPEQVLNMLSIRGGEQVMLKVRVVEMQRSVIKQFGVDVNALVGSLTNGSIVFDKTASFGVNGSLLGGVTAGYKEVDPTKNVAATVQAFERVGLVRTLAEPNLTAVSGESAKFLAGGEFPVPTGRDKDGNVTVTFKPFGVGLGFTPVVMSGGRISLKISTEVSELTNQGAFVLDKTFTIPALNVRRAETTVEMPSGGALMIAGMLQERLKQNLDKVPGASSLPVLGSLLTSRDFQNDETELVVIVEPYLASATSPSRLQTPVDGLQIADDAQALLFGRLNKAYRPGKSEAGKPAPAYPGPAGYVID
jgi:pilus assembly protein CpaC